MGERAEADKQCGGREAASPGLAAMTGKFDVSSSRVMLLLSVMQTSP